MKKKIFFSIGSQPYGTYTEASREGTASYDLQAKFCSFSVPAGS